jgi:hypothetical protein
LTRAVIDAARERIRALGPDNWITEAEMNSIIDAMTETARSVDHGDAP